MNEVQLIGKRAGSASRMLAILPTAVKNTALELMASSLEENRGAIMEANRRDIKAAEKKGVSLAFIDRLTLTPSRFQDMVDSVLQIARLADPVGEVIRAWRRPNGLEINKVRVPLGVIGIIYEARPNVSVDAGCLCLKSGNCVILRGGADAINSNTAIVDVLEKAAVRAGIPRGSIQMLKDTSHAAVKALLRLDRYVDLIIPRGGEGLIRTVVENSTIPVIKHYKGICHVYVDGEADMEMARRICFNAKVQRPGVCNAMETMLVQRNVAKRFLKPMFRKFREAGVELRGCPEVRKIVPGVGKVAEKDWSTEYLDMVLSVKVVSGIEEAIEHVNTYGSGHSDAIVTSNYDNARKFSREVDSAAVFVNASTRFTDGGEFGFGAEIGISTDKLHARGPMALEELTTYKYVVYGDGQVRE
jgi:glutamate-5-semialdehyde dehydrogenase